MSGVVDLTVRAFMLLLGSGALLAGSALLHAATREMGLLSESGSLSQEKSILRHWPAVVAWLIVLVSCVTIGKSHFLFLLIYCVFGLYLLIGLHELGHVVAAWWAGLRPVKMRVGSGWELFGFSRGTLRVSFGLKPTSGYVEVEPMDGHWTRKAKLLLYSGGPAASLLTFLVGMGILVSVDPQSAIFRIIPVEIYKQMFLVQHAALFVSLFSTQVMIDGMKTKGDMAAILEELAIPMGEAENFPEIRERASWNEVWEKDQAFLLPFPQFAEIYAKLIVWVGKDAAPKLEELVNQTLSGGRLKNNELCLLLFARAGCLAYREETVAARKCLDEAIDTASTDSLKVSLCDQAANLVIVGRLTELLPAIDRYSQFALQLQPGEITLEGTRGSILVELDQIEAGAQMLQKVFEQSESEDDKTISAFYLALASLKAGDLAVSRSWRDKMMQHSPPEWLLARAYELDGETGGSDTRTGKDA